MAIRHSPYTSRLIFPNYIFLSSVPKPTLTVSAYPSGTINVASSITLTCEAKLYTRADALQSASLSWEGPRVISDEPLYSISESVFRFKHTSNLTISHVEREDEGKYTCTLIVSEGETILDTITK